MSYRAYPCSMDPMGSSRRFNVTLDEEHAVRLSAFAKRAHIPEGTMARSLLSYAIDMIEVDADEVTRMLDRIDGAFERAQLGREQIKRGETIPLDQLQK